MSRADLGIVMLMALVLATAAAVVLTVRYTRYRQALGRGRRHVKPVWRPFWMD